jgi:uncharacterized protein (DUF305 family)
MVLYEERATYCAGTGPRTDIIPIAPGTTSGIGSFTGAGNPASAAAPCNDVRTDAYIVTAGAVQINQGSITLTGAERRRRPPVVKRLGNGCVLESGNLEADVTEAKAYLRAVGCRPGRVIACPGLRAGHREVNHVRLRKALEVAGRASASATRKAVAEVNTHSPPTGRTIGRGLYCVGQPRRACVVHRSRGSVLNSSGLRARVVSVLAVGGLALVSVVTGCGGGDHGTTAAGGHGSTGGQTGTMSTSSDPAVAFVQMMIPHHQGAIEMSNRALDTATNAGPAVKNLAAKIKAAQGPEIALMQGWLKEWGETEGPAEPHKTMDAKEMAALADAHGDEFDRMWLTQMIRHHQEAVDVSGPIAATADRPEVASLARRIIAAQNDEIVEMKRLLAG